jgi:hypothetical protein
LEVITAATVLQVTLAAVIRRVLTLMNVSPTMEAVLNWLHVRMDLVTSVAEAVHRDMKVMVFRAEMWTNVPWVLFVILWLTVAMTQVLTNVGPVRPGTLVQAIRSVSISTSVFSLAMTESVILNKAART